MRSRRVEDVHSTPASVTASARRRQSAASEDQIDVGLAAHPRLARVMPALHAISVSSNPANTSTNRLKGSKLAGGILVELDAIAAASTSCANHGPPVL